jgi:hypothetical protein
VIRTEARVAEVFKPAGRHMRARLAIAIGMQAWRNIGDHVVPTSPVYDEKRVADST